MIDIIAFFTDNGIPKTGLNPTIKIREVTTGTLVIAGESGDIMSELGDGWYKYQFSGDETINYAIVCDGGSTMPTSERYVYAGTELTEVHNTIDFIKQVESGRWKLDRTTNQMIFYKDDNTTELMRFNLYDIDGSPTVSGVAERRKV